MFPLEVSPSYHRRGIVEHQDHPNGLLLDEANTDSALGAVALPSFWRSFDSKAFHFPLNKRLISPSTAAEATQGAIMISGCFSMTAATVLQIQIEG